MCAVCVWLMQFTHKYSFALTIHLIRHANCHTNIHSLSRTKKKKNGTIRHTNHFEMSRKWDCSFIYVYTIVSHTLCARCYLFYRDKLLFIFFILNNKFLFHFGENYKNHTKWIKANMVSGLGAFLLQIELVSTLDQRFIQSVKIVFFCFFSSCFATDGWMCRRNFITKVKIKIIICVFAI